MSRKLNANAIINALQCDLEVIRLENLDTRVGMELNEMNDRLVQVIGRFYERMKRFSEAEIAKD